MSSIKKILVPFDFSPAAGFAVEKAEALAAPAKAELLFLHVLDYTPLMLADGMGYVPVSTFAEYDRRAQLQLDEAVARAADKHVVARGMLMHGSPSQTIIDVAVAEHADMIVMGTHGRSGVPRFLLGSVAERVVRTSTVPVLTVRAPAVVEEVHKPKASAPVRVAT